MEPSTWRDRMVLRCLPDHGGVLLLGPDSGRPSDKKFTYFQGPEPFLVPESIAEDAEHDSFLTKAVQIVIL